MLRGLDDLIEQRIRDAQREGQFDNLPGAGRPLQIDDDPLVPEDVRVAWRVLKNAGYVPAEVAALKDLDAVLARLVDEAAAHDATADRSDDPAAAERRADAARRANRRLLALTVALERQGLSLTTHAALGYRRAILAKLASTDEDGPPGRG